MKKNNKMSIFDWLLGIGFVLFFIGGAIILPMRIVTLVYAYNGFWSFKTLLTIVLACFTVVSGYEFFKSVEKKEDK